MPRQLLLEGADLEDLLARVRDEHGRAARIVKAERVRSGGVGGFFAKERFELTVSVEDVAQVPGDGRGSAAAAGSPEDAAGTGQPRREAAARPDWALPSAAAPAPAPAPAPATMSDLLAAADAADRRVGSLPPATVELPRPVAVPAPRAPLPSAPPPSPLTSLSTPASSPSSWQTPPPPALPTPLPTVPPPAPPAPPPPALPSTEAASFDEILRSVRAQLGGDAVRPTERAADLPRPRVLRTEEGPRDRWEPPLLDVADDAPRFPAPGPVADGALRIAPEDLGTVDTGVGVTAGAAFTPEPAAPPPPAPVPAAPVPAAPVPAVPTPPAPAPADAAASAASGRARSGSETPLLDAALGAVAASPLALEALTTPTMLASALSLAGLSPALSAAVADEAFRAGPLAADVAPLLAARRLATPVELPTGPGDVVVVAGPAAQLPRHAEALVEELAVADGMVRSVGELPGAGHVPAAGLDEIPAAAARAAVSLSPLLVLVPAPESPTGARRAARAVQAVGARAVVGIWDGARDPYDAQRWLATVAGEDTSVVRALALTNCFDAGTLTAATAGCEVAMLDGRPASVGAWAGLLVDRLGTVTGSSPTARQRPGRP